MSARKHITPGWGVFERFDKEPRCIYLPPWRAWPNPRWMSENIGKTPV